MRTQTANRCNPGIKLTGEDNGGGGSHGTEKGLFSETHVRTKHHKIPVLLEQGRLMEQVAITYSVDGAEEKRLLECLSHRQFQRHLASAK